MGQPHDALACQDRSNDFAAAAGRAKRRSLDKTACMCYPWRAGRSGTACAVKLVGSTVPLTALLVVWTIPAAGDATRLIAHAILSYNNCPTYPLVGHRCVN